MAVSICMVPLTGHVEISAAEIANHLAFAWPSLPSIDNLVDAVPASSFRIGVANVILAKMLNGISCRELEGPCSAAVLWPQAAADLKDHPAHVIVTVSAELDPVAMSTLLTQVTSSFLHLCEQALGVYWGNAAKLIRKDAFADFVTEIMPSGPPIHLWVDFRVVSTGEISASGFTTGMKSLGLMELEALNVPEPASELIERLASMAGYLAEHGPVINDGDFVAAEPEENIRVEYSESLFGHPQQVMRLIYES